MVISSESSNRITIPIRVRYPECDPMGYAHHSVYVVWLELARTELLRARGIAYRDLEASGTLFVVAKMNLRYRQPARYDDELTLTCEAVKAKGVKIEHVYEIHRGEELLCEAETTIVCVDRDNNMQRVPAALR